MKEKQKKEATSSWGCRFDGSFNQKNNGTTMTREEEIQEVSRKYFDDYMKGLNGKILTVQKTFEEGAKWADKHPNLSEEEQVGMEGLGMVWQKKHLINKAIDILIDLSNDGCLIDIHNQEEFEKQFKKKMEE